MISFREYETYCELLKYPNPEGLHPVECRDRDLARIIFRQRYADGIQDQQNLLRKQGLVETGTYPADMEARPYKYAAPAGTVMTDRGKIMPFFGKNVVVNDPTGLEKEIWTIAPWDSDREGCDDPIPLPQKCGILSIWLNEDNDNAIWITCRNADGEEFSCPWEWAECERSEQ